MNARTYFAISATVAALLAPGCSMPGPAEAQSGPLRIEATSIELNPEQPKQDRVGRLQFRGGLVLTSRAGHFGGLSGLSLNPDGNGITALSDHGDILQANFRRDSRGRVTGLAAARMFRLRGVNGELLSRRSDKRDQDSEAIRRLPDGSYLVSFEIRHRVLRYDGLRSQPTPFSIPPGVEKAPRNGGLEAMTPLPDGRILLLTEKFRVEKKRKKKGKKKGKKGDYIGWLLTAEGKSLGRVYLPAQGIFRPTDMTALPNGDVLLLQRRYTVAGGPGARLSRIPAARIKPGKRLLNEELAQIVPPMSVDNFEGLAVHPDPNGGWLVYLLSDDNFNPLQQNMLLQFHLAN